MNTNLSLLLLPEQDAYRLGILLYVHIDGELLAKDFNGSIIEAVGYMHKQLDLDAKAFLAERGKKEK